MLIKLLQKVELVAAIILSSLWAGVQLGNILICIVIVFLTPFALADWLR